MFTQCSKNGKENGHKENNDDTDKEQGHENKWKIYKTGRKKEKISSRRKKDKENDSQNVDRKQKESYKTK